MTNSKNHRDRAEIKRIKNELGIGHQAATRELARRRAAQDRSPDDGIAEVETLLQGAVGDRLRDVVNAFGAEGTHAMDEFTPFDYVEGAIEEKLLSEFEFGSVADVVEVYPLDGVDAPGVPVGVHLVIHGTGRIDWIVNVPEGLDANKFGVMEALDNGAPEPINEIETRVPVQLQVYAELDPAASRWRELEVQFVELTPAETVARAERHSRQETERLQEQGLIPPDDVIEEMMAAHERETAGREPAGPEAFRKRHDR